MVRTATRATGALTVAGLGIALVRHVTHETVEALLHADTVFFLVPSPLVAAWLVGQRPDAINLMGAYRPGKSRRATYREIVEAVLAAVRRGQEVCFAVYGHPGVGVWAAHESIRQARAAGYPARMLPGISAEACLVADLGLDPVSLGWQSYDASDLIARRHRLDPHVPLIIWQPAAAGCAASTLEDQSLSSGVRRLRDVLRRIYPSGHRVTAYEAATSPIHEPTIVTFTVGELGATSFSRTSTFYVPPLPRRTKARRPVPKPRAVR